MRNLRKDFLKLSILSLAFIFFTNISVVFADTVVTNPNLPRFAQSNILMSTITGKSGRITVGLDYQLCGTGKGYDYKDITKMTMSCDEYDPNADPNSYTNWGTFPETEVTYTILENLNLIHVYEDVWTKCTSLSDYAAYGKNYKLNIYFGEESISCPVNVIATVGDAPKHTGFCVITLYDPFITETESSTNLFSEKGSVYYKESERQSYINTADLVGKTVHLNTSLLDKRQISGIFLENYKTDEEITLFSNGGVRIDESTVVPSIRQFSSYIKNSSNYQHPKIMYNGKEYFITEGSDGTFNLGETGYACEDSIISFTDAENLADTSDLYTRSIERPIMYGDENFCEIFHRLVTKFPQYRDNIFLDNMSATEVLEYVESLGVTLDSRDLYNVLSGLGDTISLGFEKYSDVPNDLKEEIKSIEAGYDARYSYCGQFLYKKYDTEVISLDQFRSEVAAGTLIPENVMDIDITSGFDMFTGDNIKDLTYTIFEDEDFDPVSVEALSKVSSIVYNRYAIETKEFVRDYFESKHNIPEVSSFELNSDISGKLKFSYKNLVDMYRAIYKAESGEYSNLRNLVKSKILECESEDAYRSELDFDSEVKNLTDSEKLVLELFYNKNESRIFNNIVFKYDMSNLDNFNFFANSGNIVNCYADGVFDYEDVKVSRVSGVWDYDDKELDSRYDVSSIARLASNNNTRILNNSFVEKGYSVKAYGQLFKSQLLNPSCKGYVTICRNMYFGESNYPLFNPITGITKTNLEDTTSKLYARGSMLDSLYCRQNPKNFIFAESVGSEFIEFSADRSSFTFTNKVSELLDKGTIYKLIVQYSSDVEDDVESPLYTNVPGIQFAALEITEDMLSTFQEKVYTTPYSNYHQSSGDIVISKCYYDIPLAIILPSSVPDKVSSLGVSEDDVLTWTNPTDEGLGASGKDDVIHIDSVKVKITPLNTEDVEEAVPEPGVTLYRSPVTTIPVVIDLPAGTTSLDLKNYLSPGINYLIDVYSSNLIGNSSIASVRYNSKTTPPQPSQPPQPTQPSQPTQPDLVTITVRDHFSEDVTNRVTMQVEKGDPYFFKSLEKKGWKVVGESSYSGTITESMILDFYYEEDNSNSSGIRTAIIRGDLSYSDGTPMRDVTVELDDENKSTITDTLGHYEIGNVEEGIHILKMISQSGELLLECKIIVNSTADSHQAALISNTFDDAYIDFVKGDIIEIDGNTTVTQSNNSNGSSDATQPDKNGSSASAKNVTNASSDGTKTGDSNMVTVLVLVALLSLGSVALILTLNKKAKEGNTEK